jgi:hypothetical protein
VSGAAEDPDVSAADGAVSRPRRARYYLPGSSSLPRGGWVGLCVDGRETVDFGFRQEAEEAAEFFDRLDRHRKHT